MSLSQFAEYFFNTFETIYDLAENIPSLDRHVS